MISVAVPGGAAPRPGFFRVLWELIVGYVFALIALLLPTIGLSVLGVFDWQAARFREWPLRGPFAPGGVWAISADVFCAAVVVGVSTVIIAGSMQATIRLPVSRPVVALVVTFTGVAPFLYAQLLPATGPVSLLVATLLIRSFAIDRFESIRVPRYPWLLIGAAGAAVGGLALTVSFGVAHPLWAENAYTNGQQVSFSLRNTGFAKVTIIGLSEPARLSFPFVPWESPKRVEGVVVPARGSRSITLLKRGCPPKNLTVRYRLFGRGMSVRLHAQPPPLDLHC